MPHIIRLRGPWEYKLLDAAAMEEALGEFAAAPTGRADLSTDWTATFRQGVGRLRLIRRFGRPSGLPPGEVVWLAIERLGNRLDVFLNGRSHGCLDPPIRLDVTGALFERNELRIELELPVSPGEAWLEIASEAGESQATAG